MSDADDQIDREQLVPAPIGDPEEGIAAPPDLPPEPAEDTAAEHEAVDSAPNRGPGEAGEVP